MMLSMPRVWVIERRYGIPLPLCCKPHPSRRMRQMMKTFLSDSPRGIVEAEVRLPPLWDRSRYLGA